MSYDLEASEDLAALQRLDQDPLLSELGRALGPFNLFSVLKLQNAELRHSNFLAWLCDSNESHGLGTSFISSWLTTILGFELRIASSFARREWQHVDLLVELQLEDGTRGVVGIENKVHSEQRENQLSDYRNRIEKAYSAWHRRIYLFLTKFAERPHDAEYRDTTYSDVRSALSNALAGSAATRESDARMFLEHYRSLLEQYFMDESPVAKLAFELHRKHRRAIELIFAHSPDSFSDRVREIVLKKLADPTRTLAIQVDKPREKILGFLPKRWAISSNASSKNRHIFCQLALLPAGATFQVVSSSESFGTIADRLVEQALQLGCDAGKWPQSPWRWLFKQQLPLPTDQPEALPSPAATADLITDWTQRTMETPLFNQVDLLIQTALEST